MIIGEGREECRKGGKGLLPRQERNTPSEPLNHPFTGGIFPDSANHVSRTEKRKMTTRGTPVALTILPRRFSLPSICRCSGRHKRTIKSPRWLLSRDVSLTDPILPRSPSRADRRGGSPELEKMAGQETEWAAHHRGNKPPVYEVWPIRLKYP